MVGLGWGRAPCWLHTSINFWDLSIHYLFLPLQWPFLLALAGGMVEAGSQNTFLMSVSVLFFNKFNWTWGVLAGILTTRYKCTWQRNNNHCSFSWHLITSELPVQIISGKKACKSFVVGPSLCENFPKTVLQRSPSGCQLFKTRFFCFFCGSFQVFFWTKNTSKKVGRNTVVHSVSLN